MLKTHMAACLLATSLVAAPALAQTAPPTPATPNPATTAPATTTPVAPDPAAPATMGANPNPNATVGANPNWNNPGANNPGANTTAGANTGNANMAFVTQRDPGMYRASELIGTDVRGANNEEIGEVGDVLIDRNGQVRAVILDIGGFLGIGETHVAIPIQQVQMRPNQQNANNTGAVGGTSAPGANTTGAAGATGAAGQNATAGRGGADMVILVMMTKDQLRNAPKFEDGNRGSGAGGNTSTRPAGATGAGTTAPRQ